MKKTLLPFLLFANTIVFAQTTLFSETFESGGSTQFSLNSSDMSSTTSGINNWIINNVYAGGSGSLTCLGFPFSYTVASTASQPAGITASPNSFYLHILSHEASLDGITCSSFTPADGTCFFAENNFAKMNADISTMGYTGVNFSFWWACGGSTNNYGEVYYSTDGGLSWTLITVPLAKYQGQSTWIQQTISLPAFDNQASLRFGFRFVNAVTTTASEPAFNIDDVQITGNGCSVSSSTQNPTICNGDSYFAQGANQTTAGTYYDTLTNACGNDSIVTTNLTVTNVNTAVTTTVLTITASASGATYQWLNCATLLPIAGETSQSYTATANGSYAVIVTQSGCSDTSSCANITGVGLHENTNTISATVAPNPFTHACTITVNGIAPSEITIWVTDAIGKTVFPNTHLNSNSFVLERNGLMQGIYLIHLSGLNYSTTLKAVIE